ncbi:MAG: flavodoxin domain-containing protein [Myxococcota bacterium]|nr:flavodoxin domain-containing protein [Myxococcota bacterium]
MHVLVVVASATGRTQRMADAFAAGAREAGAEVAVRSADEAGESDLLSADAVALGSGVHMGGIESSMRAFFERTAPLWMQGALVGKLGAAFVSSGMGARGGAELALLSLLADLAEHGMLLVSMPSRLESFRAGGSHWGPVAWTAPRGAGAGPTDGHLSAARAHGRHLAECTARWLRGAPPA